MAKKPQNGAATEQPAETAPSDGTQKIKISGVIFSAPAPFQKGHVLTSEEAGVLNQTFSENLRNNFSKTVDKAKEATGKAEDGTTALPLSQAALDALASEFATYASNYKFGTRRVGTFAPVDPVEREARRIAKQAIESKLREQSKDKPAKDVMEQWITTLLSKRPDMTEEARKRVAAIAEAANFSLDELAPAAA